jgi:hypothetical protein
MANEYIVQYSDQNNGSIIVYQQTEDTTTSLKLVGRNSPNYGQALAENFLHLLENFSAPIPPTNPIEGQLWYDTSDPSAKKLKINDGAASGYTWYPASGVHQADVAPSNIKKGDIWVDTQALYLKIWNGVDWTLIGPSFSSANRTGSYPDTLRGSDGNDYYVIKMYLNDDVIEIIAKDSFTPTPKIDGFSNIVPGINVTSKIFGDKIPKFYGPADSALSLKQTVPSTELVSANNFVRNDIDQSIRGSLTIANDSGLKIGKTAATIFIQKNSGYGNFINSFGAGSFVFKIDDSNGRRNDVLTLDGNYLKATIGTPIVPIDLEVTGNTVLDKTVIVRSGSSSALTVSGGISSGGLTSTGTVLIKNTATVEKVLTIGKIGDTDGTYNPRGIRVATANSLTNVEIGSFSRPFNRLWVETIGSTGTGTIVYGSIQGSASKLSTPTRFIMTGSVVTTQAINFDGSALTATFTTKLTKDIFVGPTAIDPVGTISRFDPALDKVLFYSDFEQNIRQSTKDVFFADIYGSIVPTGTILPWPGGTTNTSGLPDGWVLCDGTEYDRTGKWLPLYNVLGTRYGYTNSQRYKVPNLNSTPLYAGTTTNAQTWPLPIIYIIKL